MLRQNKAGTISALLIGLLVLLICLASLGTRVSAIARQQTATLTPTPCQEDPDDCNDYATDDAIDRMTATSDVLTATSEAQTESALITPGPGTPTTTTTGTTTSPTAITPTFSPTSFPTAAPLIPSPIQLTPISDPQRLGPTETPSLIPEDVLTCFPGQPLVISGDGPPRTAFLVYFDQRVVSGGSVAQNGRFATTLVIGPERAGVYSITVRVRGTSKVLLATTCAVPNVTPTLIPRARELP